MRRFAVVVAVLLAGCSSDADQPAADLTEPPGTTAAAATTNPTTVTTAATASPEEPSSWERVNPADEAVPGGMVKVVAGGPGLVAFGADGTGGDWDVAVWTSVDGYVWDRVAHDEAVFGGPGDQIPRGLMAGGPGFVATGFENDRGAAVWTSTDGLIWTRVADIEGAFEGGHAQDVTAGDGILVAAGTGEGADGSRVAAVWTSVDGSAWTRVPHDESIFGGDGNQAVNAVAHGESGFVAVGYEFQQSAPNVIPDFDAAVWVSPDGLSWSRVPHDESIFGGDGWQGMETVHIGSPGVVALGYSDDDDPADEGYDTAVWTSTDGTDWVRVPHDEDVLGGPGEQVVRDVAEGDVGLVAVGRDASSGDDDAAIWISTDGAAWTQVNDESFGGSGGQEMGGVLVLDDRIVAVGTDRVTGEPTVVVWIGPPTDTGTASVAGADTNTSSPTDEPTVVEVPPTLLDRAEEFAALMAADGLPGVRVDDAVDVAGVYDLGDPEPAMFEWPLETSPVTGRLLLFEGVTSQGQELWGITLFVESGRSTDEGDAWIDAAAQVIVRMREPDLPESQIIDLAADLTEGGSYFEEVWRTMFTSGGDATSIDVSGLPIQEFVESDRSDPTADVGSDP